MELQRNRKEKQRNKKTKARNCDFVIEKQKRYSGEEYGKEFEDEICVEHPYHNHVLKLRNDDELNGYLEDKAESDLEERLALEEIERDYNDILDIGDGFPPVDTTTDSGFISAIDATVEAGDEFMIDKEIDAEIDWINDVKTDDTPKESKERAFIIECDQKYEEDKEKKIYMKQVSVDSLKDETESVKSVISDTKGNKEENLSIEKNATGSWDNERSETLRVRHVSSENLNENNEKSVQRKQSVASDAGSVVSKTDSLGSTVESAASAINSAAVGKVIFVPSEAVCLASSVKSAPGSVKSLESSVKSDPGSFKSVTSSVKSAPCSVKSKTSSDKSAQGSGKSVTSFFKSVLRKVRSVSSKVGSKSGSVKSVSNTVASTNEITNDTRDYYDQSRLSLGSTISDSVGSTKSRLEREMDAYERRNKIKMGYCRQADYMEKCFDITNSKVGPYPGSIQQYKNCLKHCTKLDLEIQRQKPLLEEEMYKHIPYIDEN